MTPALAPDVTTSNTVRRVIAANYAHMSNSGRTPRFSEDFAFKHVLNATDSAAGWLQDTNPLKNAEGERVTGAITNTSAAYAQAMSRFNSGVSAGYDTVLEPTNDPPRPGALVEERGGTVRYHPFDVARGWQFQRVDNAGAAPNRTRYEAVLTKQLSSARTAKLSATNNDGVVNHWDQGSNPLF